jgi:hypothetical protein
MVAKRGRSVVAGRAPFFVGSQEISMAKMENIFGPAPESRAVFSRQPR